MLLLFHIQYYDYCTITRVFQLNILVDRFQAEKSKGLPNLDEHYAGGNVRIMM